LFHAATVQNLKRQETFSIDDVPYAQKDLGLVLIGTIASDDPELNRAIISNRTNKQQVAYREGENVGEVQIKKILLGKVIISTEDGNQLLTVEHKTGPRKRIAGEDEMNLEEDSLSELQTWKKQRLSRRQRKTRSRNLNRGDN
jgi:type II secretory pathway component PulC